MKISIPPPGRAGETPRGGGERNIFKEKYGAKVEFPNGLRVGSVGEVRIFSGTTQ